MKGLRKCGSSLSYTCLTEKTMSNPSSSNYPPSNVTCPDQIAYEAH